MEGNRYRGVTTEAEFECVTTALAPATDQVLVIVRSVTQPDIRFAFPLSEFLDRFTLLSRPDQRVTS